MISFSKNLDPSDWDIEDSFEVWRNNFDLPLVTTPPRLLSAIVDDQVSLESDSLNSDLIVVNMGDFATRRDAALQKLASAADQTEKDAAIAELGKIQDEEVAAAQAQNQTQITELRAKLAAEERARTDAQADLVLERNRVRDLAAQADGSARNRRTIMGISNIQDAGGRVSLGAPGVTPAAASAAAPGINAVNAAGNPQAGSGDNNPADRRTMDERLLTDPEQEVYRNLERLNSTSFLNSIDAQSTIMTHRPDMFQEPTPDHIYNLAHRLTDAPVTDSSIREDLRQEKNMMQKTMAGYLRFSGVPGKAASWETFEIQMKGLVNQAVFKERELAVVLWGLLEGDAQLFLMSKNIFQGDSYMKMFQCLQKAYKRKPAAILQDMAQCTQGPSESVLSFTARFRIISASTFPDPPSTYRLVDGILVRNPLSQAEAMQYKSLMVQANLQAQHHYVKGLRQDIRRRMRKLRFDTMDEAEQEATEAEEELQDLGDLKDHPNPLVKPQLNMLRGQKGKGQKGQGQTKKFDGECYACNKYGHRASECRTKPNNKYQTKSRSQQDENAHVQGAINAVKGQLNSRSNSSESKVSFRGRSASPSGKSPRRSGSGSSARGQGRRGRGNSRNRDRVSFSHKSSSGKHKQKGKFNALHGSAHEEEEEYDSAASGNE